jgi:coenzyme F420-reducing hydrogenase beta subunit
MILITDKKKCCGCWACEQVCPENCISMQEDSEGFLYPVVDVSKCSDCGLCERVCPVINQKKPAIEEPASYACINNDENIRNQSSSGGIFSLLAEDIINDGGVVFGARFEPDWSVVHDYTETIEGLEAFRGSKYVESRIGHSYIDIKEFLKQERKVLFSGTPCQIAGLNHFLVKKYENLICIDIVCHSIPSPKIWKMYLNELIHINGIHEFKHEQLSNITFRDKKNGWKDYSIQINARNTNMVEEDTTLLLWETKSNNSYLQGFLKNLYVRPSCSACPARNYTSGSDIQIADFWGVEKYYPDIPIVNDDKGVSLALIITEKGQAVFNKLSSKMFNFKIKYHEVEDRALHAPLTRSTTAHKKRNKFYNRLNKMSLTSNIESCLREEERKMALIASVKKAVRVLAGRKGYELLKALK